MGGWYGKQIRWAEVTLRLPSSKSGVLGLAAEQGGRRRQHKCSSHLTPVAQHEGCSGAQAGSPRACAGPRISCRIRMGVESPERSLGQSAGGKHWIGTAGVEVLQYFSHGTTLPGVPAAVTKELQGQDTGPCSQKRLLRFPAMTGSRCLCIGN